MYMPIKPIKPRRPIRKSESQLRVKGPMLEYRQRLLSMGFTPEEIRRNPGLLNFVRLKTPEFILKQMLKEMREGKPRKK